MISGALSAIAKVPARSPIRGARLPLRTPQRVPSVSVVVASYNYGRFLGECLESVVSQEGIDLEVIVVDDASTDDTPQVAAAFAARDPRVRVIRHETNRGHIATFNEGLRAARGDYVLKLDADDLLAPGALARAAAVLEDHPRVGLVYGHPHYFEGSPPVLADTTSVEGVVVWPGRDWLAERCRTGANCISNPEAVVRRSLLEEIGYYDSRLPHTFDFEMWMRLASVSDVARVEGAVQGLYRVHQASFQRTIHAGLPTDLRGRRDAFDVAFEGPAGRLPEAGGLHARARRQLARHAVDQACRAYERGRAEQEPVDELVTIALDTWPQVSALPEWQALQRRRRAGARRARRVPGFQARRALRRVREERNMSRWLRHGL